MIKLDNLSFSFDSTEIITTLSEEFPANKINCILGPSGCGKTTLLNLISGLITLHEGSIRLNEDTFSYVFQNDTLIPWLTAEENMKLVLKPFFSSTELENEIHKSLASVKMNSYLNLFPREMSGGMKQRLSLARAFSYPSNILLMDEPFTGLDVALKNSIQELFLTLWAENKKTVLLVTHDIDEALRLSDNIFVINTSPIKNLYRFSIGRNFSSSDLSHIKSKILSMLK